MSRVKEMLEQSPSQSFVDTDEVLEAFIEVEDELNALKAHVELLSKELLQEETHQGEKAAIYKFLRRTPIQSLAEVKAQAIKDAISSCNTGADIGGVDSEFCYEEDLEAYAEQLITDSKEP